MFPAAKQFNDPNKGVWIRKPAFILHHVAAGSTATAASMLLYHPILELPDGFGLLLLAVVVIVWLGGMEAFDRGLIHLRRQPFGILLVLGQLLAEAGLAVLMIAVAIPWVNPISVQQRMTQRLSSHVDRYAALEPIGEAEHKPRLKGRCVVVATDRQGKSYLATDVMLNLPPSLRARSPEEVMTVVQLRLGERKPRTPEGAKLETCEVQILEAQPQRLLGRHGLEGEWRKIQYRNGPAFWSGSIERHEFWKYLRGLPRE